MQLEIYRSQEHACLQDILVLFYYEVNTVLKGACVTIVYESY